MLQKPKKNTYIASAELEGQVKVESPTPSWPKTKNQKLLFSCTIWSCQIKWFPKTYSNLRSRTRNTMTEASQSEWRVSVWKSTSRKNNKLWKRTHACSVIGLVSDMKVQIQNMIDTIKVEKIKMKIWTSISLRKRALKKLWEKVRLLHSLIKLMVLKMWFNFKILKFQNQGLL